MCRILLVETIYANPTDKPVEDDLSDAIRADRTFTFGVDDPRDCFWAERRVVSPGLRRRRTGIRIEGDRPARHAHHAVQGRLEQAGIAAGPVAHRCPQGFCWAQFDVAGRARIAGVRRQGSQGFAGCQRAERCALTPASRFPKKWQPFPAAARTGASGRLDFLLPAERSFGYEVVSLDGRQAKGEIPAGRDVEIPVALARPSRVIATITNAAGKPTPGQSLVHGKGRHERPRLGPRFGRHGRQERLLHPQRLVRAGDRPGQVRRDRQLRPRARRGLSHRSKCCPARTRRWRPCSSARSIPRAGSAPTFTAIRAPRATTRRASSAAC